MARAISIIFLILGISCQLLLTLQKFTAAIEGIVCLTISLLLCLYVEWRSKNNGSENTENRVIAVAAIVMILLNVLQLPTDIESQRKYDRILQNAREIEAGEAEADLKQKMERDTTK